MLGLIRRQPVVIASSWQFIDSREQANREIAERPVNAFRGPAAAREFPHGPVERKASKRKEAAVKGNVKPFNRLTVRESVRN